MSGINAVILFVVSLFFSLVIFSLWLRIALRYLRVSALHPVSQLIYTITNPIVTPIQLLSKQPYKPGQKYDVPAFITLILVELLKIICISLLALHGLIPIGFIFLYMIADLVIQPCNILFFAILIRVIMSFVNPNWKGPTADFLRLLTEPLLKLGRKIVPDISGFDFSPFIILVLLKIITLFIMANLPWRLL
ncbi:Integral membrane protein YggT, involved in response to extracytoplasmic stress (osmotic shock) [Legionella steigerwaltii]|uniref:Integral membrane protein YggT, involved in response to extracytoplasmic stress (Osmotic shock) n=1 Tax=Legionella steigerwaltii TaxID=460 RepID=A0A378L9V5_9GAMM|nr:YggT family protein [Legionella steigerwaltii]KTD79002.1 YggT family protein [Legionella steigerwaltii]STY23593.1 Integral membrane protein YggT, involved in response to extracytoplasmic stress (osmotic shock) [Legionella steigerwaltii]